MQFLGTFSKFEQCALNMSLINICDSESYVGQEMRQKYNSWKESTNEVAENLWLDLHKFTIYLPHPDQEYEDVTLEEGLTRGYNIEVEPVKDKSDLIYNIPKGGHFVVILRQRLVNGSFEIIGTGIFVRPLAIITLDAIIDSELGQYQSMLITHPIIRDYPPDWQNKLKMFLKGEIVTQELPSVVKYVDRAFNQDFRSPSWNEMYLAASGFANF